MNRIDRVNQVMGGGERSESLVSVVAKGEVELLDALAWMVDEAVLELTDDLAKAAGEEYGTWSVPQSEAIAAAILKMIDDNADLLTDALHYAITR